MMLVSINLSLEILYKEATCTTLKRDIEEDKFNMWTECYIVKPNKVHKISKDINEEIDNQIFDFKTKLEREHSLILNSNRLLRTGFIPFM